MRRFNILLVDDDQAVLQLLKLVLQGERVKKYDIFTAENPIKALKILKNNEIHLVISDERMPEMSGNDFLRQVRILSPYTIRIMLTGYASADIAIQAINKGEVHRFLTKPFDNIELLITVSEALNRYQLEPDKEVFETSERKQLEVKAG